MVFLFKKAEIAGIAILTGHNMRILGGNCKQGDKCTKVGWRRRASYAVSRPPYPEDALWKVMPKAVGKL